MIEYKIVLLYALWRQLCGGCGAPQRDEDAGPVVAPGPVRRWAGS